LSIIVSIDHFTSLRRVMLRYRPEAVETLVALVVPVVECLPAGPALAVPRATGARI
jgi:hypothetical protein